MGIDRTARESIIGEKRRGPHSTLNSTNSEDLDGEGEPAKEMEKGYTEGQKKKNL